MRVIENSLKNKEDENDIDLTEEDEVPVVQNPDDPSDERIGEE